MIKNYYASSFLWTTIAKIVNSIINFISIPLLINFYGVEKYGVLTLAMATNAYMLLLDLGINRGAIKYFAEWRSKKQNDIIDRVARTSISFYLVIGFLNAIFLLVIAIFGKSWFNISSAEYEQLQIALILLASFSLINWATSVFNQLLIAAEQTVFTQQIYILKCLSDIVVILLCLIFNLSINTYFFFLLLCHSLIIIPYAITSKRNGLISSYKPALYWNDFSKVLKYSVLIFIMGLFQATASKSRPIILGIFNTTGVDILTDYRVIEVFTIFIIAIGGSLTSIFLPRSSKYWAQKDISSIEKLAYKGTLYTSIISTFLIFPIILTSKEILIVYMNVEYAHLSIWLNFWCLTILLYLHNSPVSSLVLASGKTIPIAISSACGCIISMIVNAILCPKLGVGSAVIGYCIYILIQQINYYCIYNKKFLNLNSLNVFKSFFKPTILASISAVIIYYGLSDYFQEYVEKIELIKIALIKITAWLLLYSLLLYLFKIINIKEMKTMIKKE